MCNEENMVLVTNKKSDPVSQSVKVIKDICCE